MVSHSAADTAPATSNGRNLQPVNENSLEDSSTHLVQQADSGKSYVDRNFQFSTKVVTSPTALEEYSKVLMQLARCASEPNVFYEPWMLLPALRAFGQNDSFAFVLIFGQRTGVSPLLCGFVPFLITNRYRGIPLRAARLWSYQHFYWSAPLIRAGYERPCLDCLFEWLQSKDSPCSWIEFSSMPAEGLLARALVDAVNELGLPRYISELYTRAVLRRDFDADSCIRKALPGRRLKELGRVRRRLAEKGALTLEELTPERDISEWIEGFLALEGMGWKGRAGTALASTPEKRQFFTASAKAAFASGQLMMLRLCLDRRAIAYKCNFLSPPASFAFKIAYDEQYASYSPGVHLELENIRRFHATTGLEWMDSCAVADHFMANHLWSESLSIQSTAVVVGGRLNGLLLSMLPLLKWAKNSATRTRQPRTQDNEVKEAKDQV
jgi:hypothetical protein